MNGYGDWQQGGYGGMGQGGGYSSYVPQGFMGGMGWGGGQMFAPWAGMRGWTNPPPNPSQFMGGGGWAPSPWTALGQLGGGGYPWRQQMPPTQPAATAPPSTAPFSVTGTNVTPASYQAPPTPSASLGTPYYAGGAGFSPLSGAYYAEGPWPWPQSQPSQPTQSTPGGIGQLGALGWSQLYPQLNQPRQQQT